MTTPAAADPALVVAGQPPSFGQPFDVKATNANLLDELVVVFGYTV